MNLRISLCVLFASVVFCAREAGADTIAAAHYGSPVDRYGHFALGRPHEYARLTATTEAGLSVTLELPEDEVFEDLAPRLITLIPGEPKEILAIVSQRDKGSRLVLIRLSGDHLAVSADSPAIGTPNRWLNPVGVADFDDDGRAEIAAVLTPHIGGTLKVFRRTGTKLVEIAAMGGFSNHIFGSSETAMSTAVPIGGKWHLLVPDKTRRMLRLIAWERGALVEVGQCAIPAPVIGAVRIVSPSAVLIGLTTGEHRVFLRDRLSN